MSITGILNGRIRTMDPGQPWAEAIAWDDDGIVAVGDSRDVRGVITGEVVDAAGATVTPGLVDGHQHLFMGAEIGRGLDLDRIDTLAGLRSALAAERARIGADAWLVGFSLEYAAFEGAAYRHALIDAASGPGPMMLWSLDLHTAFANAEALRRCGIDGEVIFPDGSRVEVDEGGEPTGQLLELNAIRLIFDRIPGTSTEGKVEWYVDAMRRQNAVGITGLHLMDGGLASIDLLRMLDDEGLLTVNVRHHHFMSPLVSEEEMVQMLVTASWRGRHWSADGVKFMMDGVIDTGTAWLDEPDTHGDGTSGMWPDLGEYRSRIQRFHEAGFGIATHAIGDRAVQAVLDSYAALPEGGGGRHRIEHIETIPDATVGRFRRQGVTASMQPIHLRWMKPDLSDPWSQRLGPGRCAHALRFGDLQMDGARVVLGSDWPVAPFDPRAGFFAARARRAPDVDDPSPIGSGAPLTGEQVLAGYTVNAAAVAGASDTYGMLRPGMRADVVMWGEDPVTVGLADVMELPVLVTVSGGRIVHRADA